MASGRIIRNMRGGRRSRPWTFRITGDFRRAARPAPFEHFNRGGEPGGHWKHGGECCGACSSVSLECSEWRPVKVDNSARRFSGGPPSIKTVVGTAAQCRAALPASPCYPKDRRCISAPPRSRLARTRPREYAPGYLPPHATDRRRRLGSAPKRGALGADRRQARNLRDCADLRSSLSFEFTTLNCCAKAVGVRRGTGTREKTFVDRDILHLQRSRRSGI